MNELQITLLIIAAIFVAGLYGLHLKRKKEQAIAHSASDKPDAASSADLLRAAETPNNQPALKEENGTLVLELDADEGFDPSLQRQTEGVQSNFGRPPQLEADEQPIEIESAATREPQLFALMVIGTHTYGLHEIRNALLAIGMVYDENEQIFVRKNEQGKTYLRAANALDPGTFPAGDDQAFSTPGIALILQLPTCIHAPAAMDQMIKDARKLSQRLRAHLYNMERMRINESDLKKMRDAALDYVSVPLK